MQHLLRRFKHLTEQFKGKKYVYNNFAIYGYVGIPFAAPPLKDRRFRTPEPLKNWTGVYRPDKWPKCCHPYNEDCLYLNVFVPINKDSDGLLPTVVWIHGGAFQYGSGNRLRPHYFMRNNNMVFVTIEYRLGPLGFLYSGTKDAPGNMGLMDQQLALKWVKDNIMSFGGDNNQITAFGYSAGAASVHYHLISPKSKGLFQKAIFVSGTVTSSFAFTPRSIMQRYFQKIVEYYKCDRDSVEEKVDCLRALPANVVAQAIRALPNGAGLHPTVDGELITERPSRLIEQHSTVPILVISNKDEGVGWARRFFQSNMKTPSAIRQRMEDMFDDIPNYRREQILKAYFDNKTMSSLTNARIASANVMSDFVNLCPQRDLANDFWPEGQEFVDHVAVHPFIYGSFMDSPEFSEEEKKMGERINRMLTNFVVNGRLASDEDDWKNQATVSNGQFLEISLRSEQKRTKWPRSKTCEIWTALKNSDGEIPSFLLTENILELHRRLSFQNRFEIYGNLKNYE
ncbi:Venom carboxylesterase-6 [Nymphon striatum]|nr:Venom carboxylesterase-6 [Nymphon striatum]